MKNRIEQLREARGWSMKELGERTGKTIQQINRMEKGEAKLAVEDLVKLADVFAVTWSQIVDAPPIQGLREDAAPFEASAGSPIAKLRPGPNQDVWEVKTEALSAIGIRRGDAILVDMSQAVVGNVQSQDAVIIQLYAENTLSAATLLRQFIEPDLFISNSLKDNLPPINRGEVAVAIKAVVVSRIEPMRHGGRGQLT